MRIKSLLCAAATGLVLATPAMAQNSPSTDIVAAPFDADTAAECTATYEWMLSFLEPGENETAAQIEEFARQNYLGAMMWTYELYAAMQGQAPEAIEVKFNTAIDNLIAEFPARDTPDATNEVVRTVMGHAGSCNNNLVAQYPDGNHPVIRVMSGEETGTAEFRLVSTVMELHFPELVAATGGAGAGQPGAQPAPQ